jgi:hypothetical protein
MVPLGLSDWRSPPPPYFVFNIPPFRRRNDQHIFNAPKQHKDASSGLIHAEGKKSKSRLLEEVTTKKTTKRKAKYNTRDKNKKKGRYIWKAQQRTTTVSHQYTLT